MSTTNNKYELKTHITKENVMKNRIVLMALTMVISNLTNAATSCVVATKNEINSKEQVYDKVLASGVYEFNNNEFKTLLDDGKIMVTAGLNSSGDLQITSFSIDEKPTVFALASTSGKSLFVMDIKNQLAIICK